MSPASHAAVSDSIVPFSSLCALAKHESAQASPTDAGAKTVCPCAAGAAGGGKSSLLQLILLRHIPYKGYIAFQLPTSALPQTVSTSSSVAAAAPQGATAALTDDQRYSVTQASTRQAPASPSSHAAAAAAAADYDCSRGPAASLAYGTAPGGDGWLWAQFSFLKDDQKAARAAMAMVSVSTAVLFRWAGLHSHDVDSLKFCSTGQTSP